MAVRYTKNQRVKLAEFIQIAKEGDKILNGIVSKLVSEHMREVGYLKQHLISNDFISSFYVPAKFHLLPKRKVNTKSVNGMKGDMVEAYVWFIHTNYGYKAAERYIVKNIKNVINESYF